MRVRLNAAEIQTLRKFLEANFPHLKLRYKAWKRTNADANWQTFMEQGNQSFQLSAVAEGERTDLRMLRVLLSVELDVGTRRFVNFVHGALRRELRDDYLSYEDIREFRSKIPPIVREVLRQWERFVSLRSAKQRTAAERWAQYTIAFWCENGDVSSCPVYHEEYSGKMGIDRIRQMRLFAATSLISLSALNGLLVVAPVLLPFVQLHPVIPKIATVCVSLGMVGVAAKLILKQKVDL